MKLVYADFMKCDAENRLVLICFGTHRDLEKHNINLKDGLKLVFYNEDENDNGILDDLVAEGIVEYDTNNKRWTAKINWDEITNISKLSAEEKQEPGSD